MPSTFLLTLQTLEALPRNPRIGFHAMIHDLIAAQDTRTADDLHNAQPSPLSLGLTRYGGFGGVLGADRQTAQLRVHVLADSLADLMNAALGPGQLIYREQQVTARTVGCYREETPYTDLLENSESLHCTLHLLSPTILKAGDVFLAEPRLDLILHGLIRRWNVFAPTPAPEEAWAWATRIRSTTLHLNTHLVHYPKLHRSRRVPAFSGSIEVEFPDQAVQGALLPALKLAEWSGIGVKTAYGMGEATVSA